MKLHLTATETEAVQAAIKNALATGTDWEAPELHHPSEAIIEAVAALGLHKLEGDDDTGPDGFSTNGWQWDWWQRFQWTDGSVWTLSGSGAYGGHEFNRQQEGGE